MTQHDLDVDQACRAELRDLGRHALTALDDLLESGNPEEAHAKTSQALRCLVRLRDRLIVERRRAPSPEVQRQLDKVNALASMGASIEYPLVGVRWERISMAREALAEFLEDVE